MISLHYRPLLFSAILLLALLAGAKPTQATPSGNDWAIQYVTGLNGEDTDTIAVAGQTGVIGIAFHRVTSNDIGFASGTNATGFTVKTLDIQAADGAMTRPHLMKSSDSIWVIVAIVGANAKTYQTTNGGTTWAVVDTNPAIAASYSTSNVFNSPGHMLNAVRTSSLVVTLRESTDSGTTWSTDITFTTAATTHFLIHDDTLNARDYFTWTNSLPSNSNLNVADSQDAGGFWSGGTVVESNTFANDGAISESGPGEPSYVVDLCTSSCGVTPFLGLRYFNHFFGFAGTTLAGAVDGGVNDAGYAVSKNLLGNVLIANQGTGAGRLYYAEDGATTTPTFLSTMIDGDGTITPLLTEDLAYVVVSNATTGGRLEVWSTALPQAVIGPVATVAVTDLTGFDVDSSGISAIARVDDGETVQVFGAQSLQAGNSATDADCNGKQDGVTAYSTPTDVYLSYFECANGGGEANSLKIRSGSLGDPFIPAACSFADGDITTTALDVNVPDTLREITGLSSLPIDFSSCHDNNFAVNNVVLSWAFSTTNGQLGVFVVNEVNNAPDHSDSAFITFDGGASPNVAQMCAWIDPRGIDRLGAVGLDAGTKFYLPLAVDNSNNNNPGNSPEAAITLDFSLSGTYGLAKALSCSQDRAIIVNEAESSVSVICVSVGHCPSGVSAGQNLWAPKDPVGFLSARTAVISDNGEWASYIDDLGVHILNATSGNQSTGSPFPEPEAGIFVDMRMDASGSNLWLAYRDNIYRYAINNLTCQDNCTNVQVPIPIPTSSTSITGGLGDAANGAGEIFGGGQAGGGVVLMVMFILMFAGFAYGLFGGSPLGVALGAALGFVYSVFVGLVPPIITFLLVLAAMAAVGMRIFGGSNSGDAF